MNNNKILLISFKFPPYPGVGAYRWAKYSKYLAQQGYVIHIVTVQWNKKFTQQWYKELEHKNIIIHRIPSNYWHNLKYYKFPDNFYGKILNKIRNQLIKLSNLVYFVDEAQYWGYSLIPFCKKLIIREKIKNIIATGGPFMVNYWAGILKTKLPHIKLIHDLRDEWNETRKFLFNSQKNKSYFFEKFALNNCNAVVTVSNGLKELFSKKIIDKKIKTYIVYNGFDKERISKIIKKNIKRGFSFLYAGSLSNNRHLVLEEYLKLVQYNLDRMPEIKIYIYSPDFININKKFKDLINNGNLILKNTVTQEELYKAIYESFCSLHFMPETQSYIVSIKLFEYGILRRPVLSLNYDGDTKYLINKYKLGYSINYIKEKDLILKTLLKLYSMWKKNPNYSISPVNLDKFSYKNLTKEYINILEKIK